MKKILLICPYFGAFPNYFNLTLNSIKYNPTIDWLIITDITKQYDYPNNVKIINMKFEKLQKKVQSYFNFKINLNAPFKMCDFRPAYGVIFKEYLNGYDFWGHCDFDCIYGNLRKFLSDDILSKHERIYCLGHMSLYKNNDKINNMFKNKLDSDTDYREIFTHDRSYSFDEMGIIRILANNNIKIYNKFVFADIYPWEQPLRCVKTTVNILEKQHNSYINKECRQIFEYNTGILNSLYLNNKSSTTMKRQEYMYIHLQRRFMQNLTKDVNHYLIVPNKFINFQKVDTQFILNNSKDWILYKRYLKTRRSWNKRKIKLKKLFNF